MDPTHGPGTTHHKPDPRETDIAWNEAQDAKIDAAWEAYRDARDEATRAESEHEQSLIDPLSTPQIQERYRLTLSAAVAARLDAAEVLEQLGEDPEADDQGQDPWYPSYHGIA